jgi:hypothetical protein
MEAAPEWLDADGVITKASSAKSAKCIYGDLNREISAYF